MSIDSDPLAPLTPSEKEMIAQLETLSRAEILQELKDNLQTAIEIELATIPVYLYTYYSILRTQTTGEQLSAASQFANQAGGIIMSVAVEEMLHMSLSANILYSMGGEPQMYLKSPSPYPTPLPYHSPAGPPGPDGDRDVLIPLGKFSYEQLWHFLQIEYPEVVNAWPQDRNWETIGQFYSYIRCLINCKQINDGDFQVNAYDNQIQSDNYSPNNIDTVYPDEAFDPWGLPPGQQAAGAADTAGGCPAFAASAADAAKYPNQADSHAGSAELITINSKLEALQAIATICDQGEGFEHHASDDPSGHEQSHYYKFLSLQAQLEPYKDHVEELAPLPAPPAPISPTVTAAELAEVIVNYPDNPVTVAYPLHLQALSNLCNGVYQYMLILTETVYRVPPNEQKLFFNEGMHRSMIWVLDKLIGTMRNFKLDANTMLAPTFENISLGQRKDAFANLILLTEAITDPQQQQHISPIVSNIKTLPDVSPYWS